MVQANQSSLMMQRVVERENLQRALKQVKRNQGAAGVDGMTVAALPGYLKTHWPQIKAALLSGEYRPQAVRRVLIPKSDGRQRALGIPTVLDRFIQQAIAQVLSLDWEGTFHPSSYGFRPDKSAHQAIRQVQQDASSGKRWVVDIDLADFFDEVNHDRLMYRLKNQQAAEDVLRLINRYLKAPVRMPDGSYERFVKGVPQGGPLSPLLSNIVLDELDEELAKRKLRFARYADDCQILVGSRRAGERIMGSLTRYLERHLRLRVNPEKSAVAQVHERTFLGFGFSRKDLRIKVSDKAVAVLKAKVKHLTRRTRGHRLVQVVAELRKALLGWKAYFDASEVLSPLSDLDKWLRRRLRCYVWKQWGSSGYRQLRKLGVDRELAWNTAKSAHGPWRLSKSPALYRSLTNRYFMNLGLPSLAAR